ncbi:MAG TPA: FG-GAP-like repeat-containing protein [Dehalococcoidia bacterium]|nr:FG-GAP-like repeat-containing protein [Dehalococcoidia bacterium]
MRRWLVAALLVSLIAALALPPVARRALASHVIPGCTFDIDQDPATFSVMQTYETADWPGAYLRALELAGTNQLLPDYPAFALPPLETGPRADGSSRTMTPYVPPTLLKAIAWIESGMWQGDHSVPYGGVGPVLVSSDCGYGIMQVTTGMANTTGVPSLEQAMIAGHFAFDIARGAQILADKWNLAPEYRPLVGDRDPHVLENWYYAVWSYNGFAFSNHPANYSPLRGEYSCNAADGFNHNRADFPYQELVFGCVSHPPTVGSTPLWDAIPVTLPRTAGVQSFSDFGSDNGGGGWFPFSGDFNGDGLSDYGVKSKDGRWYVVWNQGNGIMGHTWVASEATTLFSDFGPDGGGGGWLPFAGDFNGDGLSDYGVKAKDGRWYIIWNRGNGLMGDTWAASGDTPRFSDYGPDGGGGGWLPFAGDFNGDGRTDFGVKSKDGRWYVIWNRGDGLMGDTWAASGDAPRFSDYGLDGGSGGWFPFAADFNGDGFADFGVKSRDGRWYVVWNGGSGLLGDTWAVSGDAPHFSDYAPDGGSGGWTAYAGDFNGDHRADYGVKARDGRWYIIWNSGDGIMGSTSEVNDTSSVALDPANWSPCAANSQCAPMDLATPSPSHRNDTNIAVTRTQVMGAPQIAASPASVNLQAPPGGLSESASLTVSNSGTGPLSWRLSTGASWLRLSRIQGVALNSLASGLTVYADTSGLAPGTYQTQIIVESLYPATSTALAVTLRVGAPPPPDGGGGGWFPFSGDFNGDGLPDYGVKSKDGRWYVVWNRGNGLMGDTWAVSGDTPRFSDYGPDGGGGWLPFAADFNGDGLADYGLKSRDGRWYVVWNRGGGQMGDTWAVSGDAPRFSDLGPDGGAGGWLPVAADFGGDGLADYAVKSRDGRWYVIWNRGSGLMGDTWAVSGDTPRFSDYAPDGGGGGWQPLAGELNGDGRADYGVKAKDGRWYVIWNRGDGTMADTWSVSGDAPRFSQ